MDQLTDFLRQMPKIELHVHLESTMPGWLLERFAGRQGRTLPRTPEELYHCSAEDLSDFLGFLDRICSYVGTTADLAEAAEHFSAACREENILYAEAILNPTHWPQFSLPDIISAVTEGGSRRSGLPLYALPLPKPDGGGGGRIGVGHGALPHAPIGRAFY